MGNPLKRKKLFRMQLSQAAQAALEAEQLSVPSVEEVVKEVVEESVIVEEVKTTKKKKVVSEN